jgi:septal ring factor EnvC (AmiA/AmiB activator)
VNWRREAKGELQRLPHERKALAERYTIDTKEAERREQLAAHEAARRAADDEAARRAAEDEAQRRAAEQEALRREAAEAAAQTAVEPVARDATEPELAPVEPAQARADAPASGDLPIYRWFGNS